MEKEIPVVVKDVVGPLPDGECLLVLAAGKKTFAVRCGLADADTCFSRLCGNKPSVHAFMSEIMRVLELAVSKVVIFRIEGETCCKVILKGWKKPIKLSTDCVGTGINLAQGAGIVIREGALSEMNDVDEEYVALKFHMFSLWPLSPLHHTPALEALSDFLDAVSGKVRR